MKKDVLIKILGTQKIDGEVDTVEITTIGSLHNKNDALYIRYAETQLTGMEGEITTVKVEKNSKITMLRHGKRDTQLVIERGKRHQCFYYTDLGDLMLGVTGNKIINTIEGEAGELFFSYCLDVNTAITSENTVLITTSALKA